MTYKSRFCLCLTSLVCSAVLIVVSFVFAMLQRKLFWIPFAISALATFISTVLTLFAWQIMVNDKQESKIEPIVPKPNEDNNTTPEKNSTSGREPMNAKKIIPKIMLISMAVMMLVAVIIDIVFNNEITSIILKVASIIVAICTVILLILSVKIEKTSGDKNKRDGE